MRKLAVSLVAVAVGWLAGSVLPVPMLGRSPVQPDAQRPALPVLLSSVPDVRQSTGYTCGASALQAILAYWGTKEREDRLAARLHSTPEAGTHPADIVRVAREFGLSADLREGLELTDLQAGLTSGSTVIVDLQAWRDRTDGPWSETWDDGHYMVLLGMDGENLYFEDPSLLGSRGFIPRREFVDRWHDYEGAPPLDASDRTYVRMAIFINGERPGAALSDFVKVD